MDNQLVTIRGYYQDGQIMFNSGFLPKGGYQVLITFLEPLELTQEDKTEIIEARVAKFGISKKEHEILYLIHKVYKNKQISELLDLGEGTTRNYISSLLDKLKADNRTQLAKIAIESGLLYPGARNEGELKEVDRDD